jgi:hypothetical protein
MLVMEIIMTNNAFFQACYCSNPLQQKPFTGKKLKDGIEQYHSVYPKFMNGEAVVRNVTVKQNFGRLICTLGLHKLRASERNHRAQGKMVLDINDEIFPSSRQYFKSLRKAILKKPPKLKHCKQYIIFIILLHDNFIGLLSSWVPQLNQGQGQVTT